MKLCLIAPVPPPYGGVSNWEKIIEAEAKRDSDVELTVINIAPRKRSIDGRKFFDRIFYSGYVMLRADNQLKRLIKQGKVDHVHMTTSGGLGFFRDLLLLRRLKKNRITVTYHIHFGRSIDYYEAQDSNWKRLLKSVMNATNVIAIDEKTFALLKKFKADIYCINNPVDVKAIEKHKDSTEKKVVYVGWIISAKGIEELLQAFQMFNKNHNEEYTLELVGKGSKEYIDYLMATYDCSNVVFVGEVNHEEALRRIAGGEVFVLPSYTEGSPNVILEAMALQKPIIATNVGAIPYMLGSDCGEIIEPQSVSSLNKALNTVIDSNERKGQIARGAYSRVKELFDISIIYQKYKDVWERNL